MNLNNIIVFSLSALSLGFLLGNRARKWVLLIGSVLAVFWLQPPIPIRNLDFWLPTATLAITVLTYIITRKPGETFGRENLQTALVLASVVLAIGSTRYFSPLCCLSPTRPPQFPQLLLGIVIFALLLNTIYRLSNKENNAPNIFAILILGVFIILKYETLASTASEGLRALAGQSPDLASSQDLQWLGFSYVAFRLLHTLRDRVAGRLPDLSLGEFVTYVIFIPAFTSGPIDRIQRFLGDLRAEFVLSAPQIIVGGQRIFIGAFKKFVLADSLALLALKPSVLTIYIHTFSTHQPL